MCTPCNKCCYNNFFFTILHMKIIRKNCSEKELNHKEDFVFIVPSEGISHNYFQSLQLVSSINLEKQIPSMK